MKKVLLILIVLLLMGCSSSKNIINREYEDLNDKYLSIKVNDNDIEKINFNNISDVINSTGLIYFCTPESNYCRNNINVLIDIVKDLEISKVYYIDVTGERDEFDSNFNITKEGSNEYHDFTSLYSDYLVDINNHKYIFDGDILLFSNNRIIDYLTIDNYRLIVTEKLSEEAYKKEYTRLYNFINVLNDSEICGQQDTGC